MRKVSIEEGKNLAEEEGLLFFETSAKSSYNVNEVFIGIGNKIPDTSASQGTSSGLNVNGQSNNEGRIDLSAGSNNNRGGADACAC